MNVETRKQRLQRLEEEEARGLISRSNKFTGLLRPRAIVTEPPGHVATGSSETPELSGDER
jgi:hypothetical protein